MGNAARAPARRGYAAAVALGGLAAWSLAAPAAAAAAYWPAAGPRSARRAARAPRVSQRRAPRRSPTRRVARRLGASTFRLLNLGLLAATAAHLASQAACWLVLSGLKDTVGAAALWFAPPGPPGALVAAGLQLALVGLCAWVRQTEVARRALVARALAVRGRADDLSTRLYKLQNLSREVSVEVSALRRLLRLLPPAVEGPKDATKTTVARS